MPEFQETKNFSLENKNEDCQSYNNSKDDGMEKDKVNNNIKTPEQEAVTIEQGPKLPEDLNIEDEPSELPKNEDQTQGDS